MAVCAVVALYGLRDASVSQVAAGVPDVIKTAVLPLTTLVLGFYMSRAR